jgi:hypothetical protein
MSFKEDFKIGFAEALNANNLTTGKLLTQATMVLVLFWTSVIFAIRGKWQKATFFAILWAGNSANVSSNLAHHQRLNDGRIVLADVEDQK